VHVGHLLPGLRLPPDAGCSRSSCLRSSERRSSEPSRERSPGGQGGGRGEEGDEVRSGGTTRKMASLQDEGEERAGGVRRRSRGVKERARAEGEGEGGRRGQGRRAGEGGRRGRIGEGGGVRRVEREGEIWLAVGAEGTGRRKDGSKEERDAKGRPRAKEPRRGDRRRGPRTGRG